MLSSIQWQLSGAVTCAESGARGGSAAVHLECSVVRVAHVSHIASHAHALAVVALVHGPHAHTTPHAAAHTTSHTAATVAAIVVTCNREKQIK